MCIFFVRRIVKLCFPGTPNFSPKTRKFQKFRKFSRNFYQVRDYFRKLRPKNTKFYNTEHMRRRQKWLFWHFSSIKNHLKNKILWKFQKKRENKKVKKVWFSRDFQKICQGSVCYENTKNCAQNFPRFLQNSGISKKHNFRQNFTTS